MRPYTHHIERNRSFGYLFFSLPFSFPLSLLPGRIRYSLIIVLLLLKNYRRNLEHLLYERIENQGQMNRQYSQMYGKQQKM